MNTPCGELCTSKQSELAAIYVGRNNNQPLSIAGLYRPRSGTQDQAEQICTEVQDLVRNHANTPFWWTGDFSLADISWKHNNISGNQNALGVNNAFFTLVEDIGLQQMVDFPTINNATMDLTNRPSLINLPRPIAGLSDHKPLFIDIDVEAKLRRPTSRTIFLWNDMQAFCQSFTSKFSTSHPVDSLWTAFKYSCLNVLGSNVPSKMTTERYSQPWINRQIKQLTKRKMRAYNRYKKIQSAKIYANYKHLKNVVHSTCAKRYNEHVNDIIIDNHMPKQLWSFIKSKRTDSCGVAPLKRDGIAYSDARMKASVVNHQFTSEDPSQPLPDLGPSPHHAVADITITKEWVQQLLFHLNQHKATGPNQVSPILLKETANQISPALTLVFQASINQGEVPEEWKSANITPLFKKETEVHQ